MLVKFVPMCPSEAPSSSGVSRSGRPYVIRTAVEGDAYALVQLRDAVAAESEYVAAVPGERSELEEQLSLITLRAEGGMSWVVECDDHVVGQLLVMRRKGRYEQHVSELAILVDQKYRSDGLGRALMERAVQWAPTAGIRKLSLGVFPENHAARALYRSMGFEDEGIARQEVKLPGGVRDLVRMALLLN